MTKSVDIDLLRRVTADSINVYEALSRAQTLTAESQHVVAMAEELLRQVGLAYLLNGVKTKADQPTSSSTSPKEMVSAYVQIQQSYADLKDALYQLAKAHIEAKTRDEAHTVIEGLLKIDSEYRDAAILLRQSLLNQAKDLFEQGKWEEGRTILKQRPTDKELRLAYLSSFLDEDASMNGVRALQKEEPRVSKLSSFQRTLNNAAKLTIMPFNPRKPYESYISQYTPPEEAQQKRAEYQRELAEYNILKAEYDIADQEYWDRQNEFNDSLEDLRAELSSIISESK